MSQSPEGKKRKLEKGSEVAAELDVSSVQAPALDTSKWPLLLKVRTMYTLSNKKFTWS